MKVFDERILSAYWAKLQGVVLITRAINISRWWRVNKAITDRAFNFTAQTFETLTAAKWSHLKSNFFHPHFTSSGSATNATETNGWWGSITHQPAKSHRREGKHREISLFPSGCLPAPRRVLSPGPWVATRQIVLEEAHRQSELTTHPQFTGPLTKRSVPSQTGTGWNRRCVWMGKSPERCKSKTVPLSLRCPQAS